MHRKLWVVVILAAAVVAAALLLTRAATPPAGPPPAGPTVGQAASPAEPAAGGPAERTPLILSHVKTDQPLVALSFDCCQTEKPAGYDEALVRVLVEHQTSATFFLGGRWMEAHPEATHYLASVPYFELGNHSYLHPHMTRIAPSQRSEELLRTQEILQGLTGRYAEVFRPPFGEWDSALVAAAARAGMCAVMWSVNTGDPDRHATVADLLGEFRKVRPGDIVLMHANGRGWKTAQALPQMLKHLRDKGLRPVTLEELLAAGKPVSEQKAAAGAG